MTTVMLFYAAMALIVAAIFYFGYRIDRKNAWRREKQEDPVSDDDRLDPRKL